MGETYLGLIHGAQWRFAEAEAELKRFLDRPRLEPELQKQARLNLAWVYLVMAEPDKAKGQIDKIFQDPPRDANDHNALPALGLVDVQQRRFVEARKRFEEVLIDPNM